jgi:hypothetical protein
MKRDEIIAKIRENAEALRALGAASVYLYGSHVRGTTGPESDIDLFVDRDPSRHLGFIELTELEFLLRDILGAHVDLSTRTALHPALRHDIESSAVRVL